MWRYSTFTGQESRRILAKYRNPTRGIEPVTIGSLGNEVTSCAMLLFAPSAVMWLYMAFPPVPVFFSRIQKCIDPPCQVCPSILEVELNYI